MMRIVISIFVYLLLCCVFIVPVNYKICKIVMCDIDNTYMPPSNFNINATCNNNVDGTCIKYGIIITICITSVVLSCVNCNLQRDDIDDIDDYEFVID